MDEEILTESRAAAVIGWTPANLRSHRLRHEAEQIAQALPVHDQELVLEVRKHGSAAEPRISDGYAGPALFRQRDGAWELTTQGLEVARRIRNVGRRAPVPPPADVTPGKVRYRRSDLVAWLAEHPEVADAKKLLEASWGYRETAREIGVEIGTLRTLVSRAQAAQRELRARGLSAERREALKRQASNAPPWIWAGARRRWMPVDVLAWARDHSDGPDPLERKRSRSRGPLLPELEAMARMDISEPTMRGYRARARAALRRLGEGTSEDVGRDRHRARAHPPYVLQEGQRLYHEADILEWVENRGKRGL